MKNFIGICTWLGWFDVFSDCKPLISLINNRDPDHARPRCQKMLPRLSHFNVIAEYKFDRNLIIADLLLHKLLCDKRMATSQHTGLDMCRIHSGSLGITTCRDRALKKPMVASGWHLNHENILIATLWMLYFILVILKGATHCRWHFFLVKHDGATCLPHDWMS